MNTMVLVQWLYIYVYRYVCIFFLPLNIWIYFLCSWNYSFHKIRSTSYDRSWKCQNSYSQLHRNIRMIWVLPIRIICGIIKEVGATQDPFWWDYDCSGKASCQRTWYQMVLWKRPGHQSQMLEVVMLLSRIIRVSLEDQLCSGVLNSVLGHLEWKSDAPILLQILQVLQWSEEMLTNTFVPYFWAHSRIALSHFLWNMCGHKMCFNKITGPEVMWQKFSSQCAIFCILFPLLQWFWKHLSK